MRRILIALLCAATVTVPAFRSLPSQNIAGDSARASNKTCNAWLRITTNFGSEVDSVYNRCALESAPFLFGSPGFTRLPANAEALNALLFVVVEPPFKTNLLLTREASPVLPDAYDEAIYAALQRWTIAAGRKKAAGEVRSAFPLVLQVPARNVPMPSLVKWTHIRSRTDAPDTMRGSWVTAAPETPMSDAQIDEVYLASVKDLVDQRVVLANSGHRYCIAFPAGDSLRARRLNDKLQDVVDPRAANVSNRIRDPFSCIAGDSARKIALGRVDRSEDNQVSVSVRGDFLLLYPRDVIGRTWREWRGQCSAPVPAAGAQTMHCKVEQVGGLADDVAAEREKSTPQYVVQPAGGDSIRVRVITLGESRSQTDTMYATMALPSRLSERALQVATPACEGRQAFSANAARGRYVLFSANMQDFISLIRVYSDTAPRRFPGVTECPTATTSSTTLTAFVLGDLGTKDSVPITVCYFECTDRYSINPARHTLAERAVLSFHPANLRQEQGQYDFRVRIDVDRAPDGLTPFAVFYYDRFWRSALVLRPFGVNAWVALMGSDTGGGKNAPADQEVRIYFFRK